MSWLSRESCSGRCFDGWVWGRGNCGWIEAVGGWSIVGIGARTCVNGRRRGGGDHLRIIRVFALVLLSSVAIAEVSCKGRVGKEDTTANEQGPGIIV